MFISFSDLIAITSKLLDYAQEHNIQPEDFYDTYAEIPSAFDGSEFRVIV